MATTPFTLADNISSSTKDILTEDNEDQYVAFIINRHLSHFADAVFYANDVNAYAFLSKRAQYLYLLSTIPKRKRFSKWAKKDGDPLIEAISKRYACSGDKAREIACVLTEDAKNKIMSVAGTNGKTNRQPRRGKTKA